MGCARDNQMIQEGLRMEGIYIEPSSPRFINRRKSSLFEVTVIRTSYFILKLFEKSVHTLRILF